MRNTDQYQDTRTQPRWPTADVAKGIAVLLMIQVHLTELFAIPSWYDGIYGKISLFLGGAPAAPVFMFFMGVYASKTRTHQHMLKRGLKLIGWGLLLNAGLNAHLIIKHLQGQIGVNVWEYLFGVDIFFLAGLSLLLMAFWRALFHHRLWAWLLLLLLIPVIQVILPFYEGKHETLDYVFAFFHSNKAWSYFPLFPWAFYPVAGFTARLLWDTYASRMTDNRYYVGSFALLTAALITTFDVGFEQTVQLSTYYHHNWQLMIWNLGFVFWEILLLQLLVNQKAAGSVQSWLAWNGTHVTPVYVFQWLMIGNLATWLYKTQFPLQWLMWYIAVVAISNLLTVYWLRWRKWIH